MLTSRIHEAIVFLQPMVSAYESLVLLKFSALSFPGFALCILGQTISTCMNVRAMQLDNRYYWLHSLLLVVLTGFGGGIAGFMMLGKPPIIVTNELIIPTCIICWYATHYLGLCPLLALPPFKLIWTTFASLFRTHAICNIVALASKTLPPSDFYAIPLIGPIVVGTTLGSFSQFLPLDKGLLPIRDGCPWALQGAFISASLYHLMVHDTAGPVGTVLRSIIGSYSESETRLIIGTMWLSTGILQAFFSPQANPLHPLHKLLYLIFQVDGPKRLQKGGTVGWDYRTRLYLERWIELSRVLVVLVAISAHVYYNLPPSRINPGMVNVPSSRAVLGSCQLLPQVQRCTPHALTLNMIGQTYHMASASSKGDEVWSYDFKVKNASPPLSFSSKIELKEDGSVRIVKTDQKGEEIFISKSKCSGISKTLSDDKGSDKSVYLKLDTQTGQPVVVCTASESVPLAF